MSISKMRGSTIPRLAFQRTSQSGQDYWHSVLISLLRGGAAFIVAAAHLRAAMYPGLRTISDPPLWFQGFAFITGFGHHAVLVFFVISGWLVGGSLLDKLDQPNAFLNYAIDRLTRIWTVLIPTFCLTLLFASILGAVDITRPDYSADNPCSGLVFAGNLVGLQRVLLPDFGGNFALWSLANETWYYVLFPLLVLLVTLKTHVLRAACAGIVLLIIVALPSSITAYFIIWLLGVALSRVRIDCSGGVRLAWLGLLLAVSAYYRLTGSLDDFSMSTLPQDLICSLLFLLFLSSLQFRAAPGSVLLRPLGRIGGFIAEFSFSLYVFHVPSIALLAYAMKKHLGLARLSPYLPLHFAIYMALLVVLLAAAYLAYRLFEAQTYRIRRCMKQWIASARRTNRARTAQVDV